MGVVVVFCRVVWASLLVERPLVRGDGRPGCRSWKGYELVLECGHRVERGARYGGTVVGGSSNRLVGDVLPAPVRVVCGFC
jgi:hypothetical protein